MRNNIYFVLALSLIILSGCVSNPRLPQYTEVGSHPYGAIIEMTYRSDEFISGELIAVGDSSLIILDSERKNCLEIPKKQIIVYEIQFAQPKHYGLSILLLPLSTLSHGFIASITFPVNFVATCIITGTAENKYTIRDKKLKYEQLYMYARFPQGLPEGIKLIDIRY